MHSFDKNQFIGNIKQICKDRGIKIGALETRCEVSQGYLSRLSKEGNTAVPSIDVVCSFSKELGVNIETLLFGNLEGTSETARYLIYFINEMIQKTKNGKLSWNYVENDDDENEALRTPLIKLESVDCTKTNHTIKFSYFSQISNQYCEMIGPLYYVKNNDGSKCYLSYIKIKGSKYEGSAYELYVETSDGELENVCQASQSKNAVLYKNLNYLYSLIGKEITKLNISTKAKGVIDSFLKD